MTLPVPSFDVGADPGGPIDGVGERDAEVVAQLAQAGPSRIPTCRSSDHGGVEAALGEELLQLLRAAHHGNPGHPAPPPARVVVYDRDGSLSAPKVGCTSPRRRCRSPGSLRALLRSPRPAPRRWERRAAREDPTGPRSLRCRPRPPPPFTVTSSPVASGRQVDAQLDGAPRRGCRRTHALGCRRPRARVAAAAWPGGVFLEHLGGREHVRDRLGAARPRSPSSAPRSR